MQIPLIKDGRVVNVVEIGQSTLCVTKAEHRQLEAQENAKLEKDLSVWQAEIDAHSKAIEEVKLQYFMALGIAKKLKESAKDIKSDKSKLLDRILLADSEVEAWADKIADMKSRKLPKMPQAIKAKRWIYPDGFEVGPVGGNIGDFYENGKYRHYTERPE